MDPGISKLRLRLIGFGLLWIAIWAIFGSLLGYRIQEEIISGQDTWLVSVQRDLLRSAHSHMNAMGILCLAVGLALPLFDRILPRSHLKVVSAVLPASIALFGAGLVTEAFLPPAPGSPTYAALITALGGSVFILLLLYLGVGALRRSVP